jgi:REJ domain
VHTTSFSLICTGWEDPDPTSLLYSFYFSFGDDGQEYALGNEQLSPFKTVYLTPGIVAQGIVTLIAYPFLRKNGVWERRDYEKR